MMIQLLKFLMSAGRLLVYLGWVFWSGPKPSPSLLRSSSRYEGRPVVVGVLWYGMLILKLTRSWSDQVMGVGLLIMMMLLNEVKTG